MGGSSVSPMLIFAVFAIVLVVYAIFAQLARLYQKVGPNEVLVVSGGGGIKLITGGGQVVWPFIQKADRFSLEIMTIDVVTPEVYTNMGVPIIVDAVAQVKVKNDQAMMRTAVERFLTKSPAEIIDIIKQTLEGHTRAIIGKMQVEEIIKERDKFASNVAEVSHDDLSNMGLVIDSFAIRDIRDNQGYLAALGKPETAAIKSRAIIAEAERNRDAAKATADATKEAQVAQAIASKESQIAQASAARDSEIAKANAKKDAEVAQAMAQQQSEIARIDAKTKVAEKDREYRIKQAEYNKDSKQKEAEADLSYDLQKNITQQQVKEQEIRINVVEKEKQIEVQEKEVERREKELEATVKKPAEAQRFQIETLANAKQFELKALAMGEAEASKQKGFASAEVVRAQGLAEAEAEKAQGLARAEVIRATGFSEAEAMTKKALAWKSYNEAAILEKFIEKMPEIARSIAAPLAKTEKIIMISGDGGGGSVSKFTSDMTRAVAEIPPVMEALTGIKISDMIKKVPGLGSGIAEEITKQLPGASPQG
ncbi:MAG: SPFH domain-containing protein [Candidatus Eremiobacteraeota bacterium]|nr:SPFH domain-containing protein [Candidatus Eremiobacteraeota bacterium]